MNWKDKLTDSERVELEQAKAARDAAKTVYNAVVKRLKNRCESRMRAERDGNDA